ncbi:MAG: DUF3500 domain-containing protein [Planctomycetota bacterium]
MRTLTATLTLLLTPARAHAHDAPPSPLSNHATTLIESLDDTQRQQCVLPLDDDNRLDWHYIPRDRKGLSIKTMTDDQRALTHNLLASALSSNGYLKATSIMQLEEVLRQIEEERTGQPRPHRDLENYLVTIFGDPASPEPWAMRFEGHHLSLNYTSTDNHVAVSPAFFGTNPAQVRSGPMRGMRVLAREEDTARALVKSLSPEQLETALVSQDVPSDVFLSPGRELDSLPPVGITASNLDDHQLAQLHDLIRLYLNNHDAAAVQPLISQLEQFEPNDIRFAWRGSTQPGKAHYYSIHTPAFVIEYDNSQNNANHIHSAFRDLRNDFAHDLLREHYESAHNQ